LVESQFHGEDVYFGAAVPHFIKRATRLQKRLRSREQLETRQVEEPDDDAAIREEKRQRRLRREHLLSQWNQLSQDERVRYLAWQPPMPAATLIDAVCPDRSPSMIRHGKRWKKCQRIPSAFRPPCDNHVRVLNRRRPPRPEDVNPQLQIVAVFLPADFEERPRLAEMKIFCRNLLGDVEEVELS